MTPTQAFVERHFSVAEIGGVFWSAVGSGAPHRFFSAKKLARGKSGVALRLPGQAKMRLVQRRPPINLAAVSLHATPWPHAPMHQLGSRGAYFVTASTLHHAPHFKGKEAPRCPPSRRAQSRGGIRLATRGMGDFLESLSFCCSIAGAGRRREEPQANAQLAS